MYRISALAIGFLSLLVPLSAELSFRGLIEREMAASEDPSDKLLLKEIIEGLRAGDFRIISTEGKPLRREEHPEMSQEKFDRINKLMQMTPEQVQAMIDTGTDPKAPTEAAR